jgi:hypothetical protein
LSKRKFPVKGGKVTGDVIKRCDVKFGAVPLDGCRTLGFNII